MIKVAIVEDDREVREGLAFLIGSHDGFEAVEGFGDAEALLESAGKSLGFDVVLMDIGLPGMNGIDATRTIKERYPSTDVIMLTVYGDDESVFTSLRAGASGYVLKTTEPLRLVQAVREVAAGGSPMSGAIARRVVESFQAPDPSTELRASLTEREGEILDLLIAGLRYREISEKLFISIETVRTHIRHIYEKLHVRSRGELTAKLLQAD